MEALREGGLGGVGREMVHWWWFDDGLSVDLEGMKRWSFVPRS